MSIIRDASLAPSGIKKIEWVRSHMPALSQIEKRYYYNGRNQNSFFGAVYTFTTDDHSCEGEIRLTAVSDEFFADNGHSIAWAMAH